MQAPRRVLQDRLCRPGVAEEQVAGALEPPELIGAEQDIGRVAWPHAGELGLGTAEGILAAPTLTEHRERLADVQQRQPRKRPACSVAGEPGGLLRQRQPPLRVMLAVQRDKALAKQG